MKMVFISLLFAFCSITYCQEKDANIISLFDGKTLTGWYAAEFYRAGNISVKDSAIYIEKGKEDISGINYAGEFPASNYELRLEARRIEGNDFFCGITFPVKNMFCSLIIGGWNGSVLGLSNIDGYDAVNNQTGDSRNFVQGRWYAIRLRVTDNKIEAWLNNSDKIVDFRIDDSYLSVRREVELSIPFGIATWKTTGAIRNIEVELINQSL